MDDFYTEKARQLDSLQKSIRSILYNNNIWNWPEEDNALLEWLDSKANIKEDEKEEVKKLLKKKIEINEEIKNRFTAED